VTSSTIQMLRPWVPTMIVLSWMPEQVVDSAPWEPRHELFHSLPPFCEMNTAY
jgi:hypothetical protein